MTVARLGEARAVVKAPWGRVRKGTGAKRRKDGGHTSFEEEAGIGPCPLAQLLQPKIIIFPFTFPSFDTHIPGFIINSVLGE